jgi:integrase
MEVYMGSLYKRGNTWWIKYYKNGKSYRESSGTDKKMVAKKVLERREGDFAQGKMPGIQFDKVTFDELAEEFLTEYKINARKSLDRAEKSVDHLKGYFAGYKVSSINSPAINAYIKSRLEKEAANGTINRELSALKRMLYIGAKQMPPIVDRVPLIPMLKESNIRKGFFEHSEFIALRNTLPVFLKGFVTFGYKTGWRISEIFSITWAQVDRNQGIVRLEVGETKNNDGRTVYFDDELKDVFNQQWELLKAKGVLIPYVFPNQLGTGPIKDIRRSWSTALQKASLNRRLFHDLRRTAVRNMVRSGIPERVAMMISGHKTRSVFDRYNIVSQTDLKEAAKRQEEYLENQMGTITKINKKKAIPNNG